MNQFIQFSMIIKDILEQLKISYIYDEDGNIEIAQEIDIKHLLVIINLLEENKDLLKAIINFSETIKLKKFD